MSEHVQLCFNFEFILFQKAAGGDEERSKYEMDRIQHAKRIMKPFFLRRLKSEVLGNLPEKTEEIIKVPMTEAQHETYFKLVQEYKKRAKDVSSNSHFSTYTYIKYFWLDENSCHFTYRFNPKCFLSNFDRAKCCLR